MAKVTGVGFLVKIGGSPASIGSQRGGTLNFTQDVADASDKQGGGWKEHLRTLRGASVSCDGAVLTGDTAYEAVKAAIEGGSALTLTVLEPDAGTASGSATCKSFNRNAPHDGVYTYTCEFEFNGTVTIT